MSTRGCVAVGTIEEWTGLYNHANSNPLNLGKEVWAEINEKYKGDLAKFCKDIMNYDDWRNFKANGVCKFCGFRGNGQPTAIHSHIYHFDHPNEEEGYKKVDDKIKMNIDSTGFPDPDCKYHEHKKLTSKVTSENPDPLFIEWIYLLNPKDATISILSRRKDKDFVPGDCKEKYVKDKDGYYNYGHCRAKHGLVILLNVGGKEPDWEAIQKIEA